MLLRDLVDTLFSDRCTGAGLSSLTALARSAGRFLFSPLVTVFC